jgi:TonB family protein
MQRYRLFAATIVLIVGMAQPTALLCQDNSMKETYDGEPLCRRDREVPPHPTYTPDPDYDDKDRKAKAQGTVVLSVVITKEGRTADTKVIKKLTPGLEQQAIKTVSRWKFDPATQDGEPCPVRINVTMQFHLY